jgi:hypothetical protein
MILGMVFDKKRKGETPSHIGRSKGHGRDARATTIGSAVTKASAVALRAMAQRGGGAPIYVSAKRTHRFAAGFFTQPTMHMRVAEKMDGNFRWVRFGKRTHREGVMKSFSSKSGFISGKRSHFQGVWRGDATR